MAKDIAELRAVLAEVDVTARRSTYKFWEALVDTLRLDTALTDAQRIKLIARWHGHKVLPTTRPPTHRPERHLSPDELLIDENYCTSALNQGLSIGESDRSSAQYVQTLQDIVDDDQKLPEELILFAEHIRWVTIGAPTRKLGVAYSLEAPARDWHGQDPYGPGNWSLAGDSWKIVVEFQLHTGSERVRHEYANIAFMLCKPRTEGDDDDSQEEDEDHVSNQTESTDSPSNKYRWRVWVEDISSPDGRMFDSISECLRYQARWIDHLPGGWQIDVQAPWEQGEDYQPWEDSDASDYDGSLDDDDSEEFESNTFSREIQESMLVGMRASIAEVDKVAKSSARTFWISIIKNLLKDDHLTNNERLRLIARWFGHATWPLPGNPSSVTSPKDLLDDEFYEASSLNTGLSTRARTPRDAVKEYLRALQSAVNARTQEVLQQSGYDLPSWFTLFAENVESALFHAPLRALGVANEVIAIRRYHPAHGVHTFCDVRPDEGWSIVVGWDLAGCHEGLYCKQPKVQMALSRPKHVEGVEPEEQYRWRVRVEDACNPRGKWFDTIIECLRYQARWVEHLPCDWKKLYKPLHAHEDGDHPWRVDGDDDGKNDEVPVGIVNEQYVDDAGMQKDADNPPRYEEDVDEQERTPKRTKMGP